MEMLKLAVSLFRRGFKSSKCKTTAKLTTARIKLLRNKREVVVRQMRRDVALLLQSGQDATARIREFHYLMIGVETLSSSGKRRESLDHKIEHVIREQNIMGANDIIELFCELIVARLSIIAKQRECPADLKEGISSLIFAAPRCSEIPELQQIRNIFEKKYGTEFVSAAMELRPGCSVNRTLIEKLSVRRPTGEVKLKLMKEIAKEYQIEWDAAESEKELLKPPEENIEGPSTFVSASSMPIKPLSTEGIESKSTTTRSLSSTREESDLHFGDSASAAKAAAESAKMAIAAAKAAAFLAGKDTHSVAQTMGVTDTLGSQMSSHDSGYGPKLDRSCESLSFDGSSYLGNEKMGSTNLDCKRRIYRRHSYNVPAVQSDIKFDESDISDCGEEIEMEMPPCGIPPPDRPPPPIPSSHGHQADHKAGTDNPASYRRHSLPRVHPKLPDYDVLSARFEALKHPKS